MVEPVAFDRMNEASGWTVCRNQVIPPPRRQFCCRLESHDSPRDRVRPVKIVEQPTVETIVPQGTLDRADVQTHSSQYSSGRTGGYGRERLHPICFDVAHRRTAGGFLGAKCLVVSCAVRRKAPDGRSHRRLDHSERRSRMRLQILSSSLFLGFFLFFDCGCFVHLFEEGSLDNAVLMAELVVAPRHAAVSRDS